MYSVNISSALEAEKYNFRSGGGGVSTHLAIVEKILLCEKRERRKAGKQSVVGNLEGMANCHVVGQWPPSCI